MKKYIILFLIFSFVYSFSKDKELKSKNVNFGEELKVEILAQYHIDNIQWFKDGVPLKGANQREYKVKNARLSDEGIYYATMMGPCSEITSLPIFVRVNLDNDFSVETITAGNSVLLFADPNPVLDLVKFKFNLDETKGVKLILNDLLGNQIAIIYDGVANEGPNVIDYDIRQLNLTNGTYFYTIITDNFTATRALQVLR
ncbi:MAG TPA: T9SS type A sorting domain-containing protein [Candidatus Kapabacteria bacterium]|nr:T9SS type A sorting domain-containing protein [Candidatus Kapabacteria bacterium]